MLIVALGWSLLEAIMKSKTEHIVETDGTLTHMPPPRICNQDIHQNVHSQHWGGHSTSRTTNYLSSNVSLGGTLSTGMTVSDKIICLLEDLGNSFERVQMYPLAWRWRMSVKDGVSFLWRVMDVRGNFSHTLAKSQTFLSCNPRDRHVFLL